MSTIPNPLAWLDKPAEVGQPAKTAPVATRAPGHPAEPLARAPGPASGPRAVDDEPAELPEGVLEGDDELAERVAALSPEGRRLWLESVRRRQAAGEPSDGLGWRALVDVRIARRGTPDGWPPRPSTENLGDWPPAWIAGRPAMVLRWRGRRL